MALFYIMKHYLSTDIMVGFEQTSYTITEGASREICVVIISPDDDIGTTNVYLEVIPIDNPDGVGTEASKFTHFSSQTIDVCTNTSSEYYASLYCKVTLTMEQLREPWSCICTFYIPN